MEERKLEDLSLKELLNPDGVKCSCGRRHYAGVRKLRTGSGILEQILDDLEERNVRHPAVVADQSTYEAAGKAVCRILEEAGISPFLYVMNSECPEPDEYWAGALALRFDRQWDGIIAVGSGTVNDICKIAANMTGLPYLIVATAPSMDGYASETSSMVRGGLKVSIPSKCAEVIIADSKILAGAPEKMIQAGLGDMAAKYVSICEWRISHLITGEYYCEEIAGLVRKSLKTCMDSCGALAKRDEQAAENVASGLIMAGISMSFAGLSRPASGTEHYFSHMWEMTALEHHAACDLHGRQVGVGTLLSLQMYELLRHTEPDRKKAQDYAEHFDKSEWEHFIRCNFGSAAQGIIEKEEEEGKYKRENHARRLEKIIAHWDQIQAIIHEELPDPKWLREQLRLIHAPITPEEIGVPKSLVKSSFLATKDIRDKYIGTRLLWDLGILEEAADRLFL